MQKPLSLSELNQLIRQTLDTNLEPSYWVLAEIGELRDSARGHAYLELVEKSADHLVAKIKANIWSYTYQGLQSRFVSATGQRLRGGMKILALVSVQFHEIYGLSINVKDIDPNYTIGERAKRKKEIIDQLTREGLIELNKQFILPKVPQRLAVISSSSAAGFEDFVNQLEHNSEGYAVHWELYPAIMQGSTASASIIKAIETIEADAQDHKFDLLVIIRGGGAQTDLDCFDNYDLARAVANTTLPVVTGIGHERDESVVDLVANTKMKTPTAVAEFVLYGFRDFEEKVLENLIRIERSIGRILQVENRKIRDKELILQNLFLSKTRTARDKLDGKKQGIISLAQNALKIHRFSLEDMERSLQRNAKARIVQEVARLDSLEKDINRLDPLVFLSKGYTRTEVNGIPIQRAEIENGDELTTFSLTKKIKSNVTVIEKHEQ